MSRRIAALEKDLNAQLLLESCERIESAMSDARVHSQARRRDKPLSGLVRVATTEAFGTYVITPILAGLHRSNPELQVEIVTQTRLSPYNSGADIEIGLGEPVIGRPGADKLTDYSLGLYASDDYAEERGLPTSIDELHAHSMIYYIEGLLRVEDLDVLAKLTAARTVAFASTSVHAQTVATLSSAGIGLLPAFVADREKTLRRVLYPLVRSAAILRLPRPRPTPPPSRSRSLPRDPQRRRSATIRTRPCITRSPVPLTLLPGSGPGRPPDWRRDR